MKEELAYLSVTPLLKVSDDLIVTLRREKREGEPHEGTRACKHTEICNGDHSFTHSNI